MSEIQAFNALALDQAMVENLALLGYETMTPIQAQSLPAILEGRDVIAQAKTGSGKTAAFGIGLLSRLELKKYRVQSLVLCPTRELADQVAKELRRLARFAHNIKILTLCGGMPFGPQLGSLRHEAHIIVGTPGRVLKHLEKKSLSLENLNTLVLDEADRMLDMGFIEEIDKVIAFAPKARQTLLFSATYPEKIMELSATIQNDALSIETVTEDLHTGISEFFYEVEDREKINVMIKLLALHRPKNAIIFSNTKLDSQEIADALTAKGVDALAIHGDLEQIERNEVLVQFSNHSCAVLVATDMAARGLDIKELGMVINYELSHDEAVYTHRIGRTGRAGETGVAVTLYDAGEAREVVYYENSTRTFGSIETLEGVKQFKMEAPFGTLVIDGGKKEKVRAGDILGALTKDAGIAGNHVGKIDIFDRKSYVAIDRSIIDQALKKLKRGQIKGRNFSVWILK